MDRRVDGVCLVGANGREFSSSENQSAPACGDFWNIWQERSPRMTDKFLTSFYEGYIVAAGVTYVELLPGCQIYKYPLISDHGITITNQGLIDTTQGSGIYIKGNVSG